jgi:hypothetical protein
MTVVASWKIHSKAVGASNSMSHSEFRRDVVVGLLKSSGRKRLGGPSAPMSVCVRYDGVEHFIASTTQGRCVECGKNTKKRCTKCEKRLHETCFELYHFKPLV